MTKCSVVGCGARKNGKHKSLTLHRLPRCENKKKIWLEAIGTNNIMTHKREIYICSLHFHDNAFNKTLDVVRLRDDALPSHRLLPNATQDHSTKLTENRPDLTPLADHNYSNLLGVKTAVTCNAPRTIPGTPGVQAGASKLVLETATMRCISSPQPVSGTSGLPTFEEHEMEKLKETCDSLRKKVKSLNEKIRRKNKKIANFKNIIIDLHERILVNDDSSSVLEACAEPNDFLPQQFLVLPLESQYSEET